MNRLGVEREGYSPRGGRERPGSESESHSVVSDPATPWTVARQAPLSMGLSRQGYWRGLPFPSPGDLPDPGIKPRSPTLQADSLPSEPLTRHTEELIAFPQMKIKPKGRR